MEGPAPQVSGTGASGVWWVKNTEAPTQGHLIPMAEPAKSKSLKAGAQTEGTVQSREQSIRERRIRWVGSAATGKHKVELESQGQGERA